MNNSDTAWMTSVWFSKSAGSFLCAAIGSVKLTDVKMLETLYLLGVVWYSARANSLTIVHILPSTVKFILSLFKRLFSTLTESGSCLNYCLWRVAFIFCLDHLSFPVTQPITVWQQPHSPRYPTAPPHKLGSILGQSVRLNGGQIDSRTGYCYRTLLFLCHYHSSSVP